MYFNCISINLTVKKILDEIRVFLDLLTSEKKPIKNDFFIPEKRKEVIKYIVNGVSPQKISSLMGVSTKTISSHKRMIMSELSVKTTVELIIKYKIIDEFIICGK